MDKKVTVVGGGGGGEGGVGVGGGLSVGRTWEGQDSEARREPDSCLSRE